MRIRYSAMLISSRERPPPSGPATDYDARERPRSTTLHRILHPCHLDNGNRWPNRAAVLATAIGKKAAMSTADQMSEPVRSLLPSTTGERTASTVLIRGR